MDLQTNSPEETANFESMLDLMEPKLLQDYKTFLHEVLIKGICHYQLTLNTLRRCLDNMNKEVMEHIVENAISYYDDRAPNEIKSFGIQPSVQTNRSKRVTCHDCQ